MLVSRLTFKIDTTNESLNLFDDADDRWVVSYVTDTGVMYQQQFSTNYAEAFRFYVTVLKRILTTLDVQTYITDLFN